MSVHLCVDLIPMAERLLGRCHCIFNDHTGKNTFLTSSLQAPVTGHLS